MKQLKLRNTAHEAQQWAYDFYATAISNLPPQVRNNIDWDMVAEDLKTEGLMDVPPTVEGAIERIIEYLYEAEESDYETVELQLKGEHIFESVLTVQRWLDSEPS